MTMLGNFDFDVIRRALPYLFFEGMRFTLTLTFIHIPEPTTPY